MPEQHIANSKQPSWCHLPTAARQEGMRLQMIQFDFNWNVHCTGMYSANLQKEVLVTCTLTQV